MVRYTDPADHDSALAGGFNWTFELDADLAVPEADFPMDKSLGVFSWRYDEARGSGVVRMYQRVSPMFAWICTYFGADVGEGVKANQAYDGRGMMTEHPIIGTDFKTRFWLNITKNQIHGGGGVGSWCKDLGPSQFIRNPRLYNPLLATHWHCFPRCLQTCSARNPPVDPAPFGSRGRAFLRPPSPCMTHPCMRV